ncbi:MAG: flavodoxin family protein [Dethiosulfovibrio sp.]|nr:flavodoxin family protein [Dethiosulfovibrio sp.]
MLALNGSPKGANGNTQIMVDTFFEGAQAAGAETKTIYMKDLSVGFCRGCFSCWTVTPGRCIQKDDMDMVLAEMGQSDAVIWATPLYHYGMTAMLKAALERTLPLVDPHMVKEGDTYGHPVRNGDRLYPKTLLFSNCGFPEIHHFDGLISQFDCLFRGRDEGLAEVVLRPAGGLLSVPVPELQEQIRWYYDALKRAGEEFVSQGRISSEVCETLKKDFMPTDSFVSMVNSHWDRCLKGKKCP